MSGQTLIVAEFKQPEFKQPLTPPTSQAVSWSVLTSNPGRIPVLSPGSLEGLEEFSPPLEGPCLTAQPSWAMPRVPVWFVHHKDHPKAVLTRPLFSCHTESPSKPCTANASFLPHLPLSTPLVTIKMLFWSPISNSCFG